MKNEFVFYEFSFCVEVGEKKEKPGQTDSDLPPGTSNWSETYFTQTAGVGLVVNQTGSEVKKGQQTLQSQVEALFLRDWTSEHAAALSLEAGDVCPRGSH